MNAPILTKLFNASLTTSIIPSDWKLASVAPVYKGKGDKFEKGNYRPISVIGYIAKVFEMQVQKQFLKYFVASNYISIDQSAYRQCQSTQTSLHRFIDDWPDNVSDDL